jgi:hypothetical protein
MVSKIPKYILFLYEFTIKVDYQTLWKKDVQFLNNIKINSEFDWTNSLKFELRVV